MLPLASASEVHPKQPQQVFCLESQEREQSPAIPVQRREEERHGLVRRRAAPALRDHSRPRPEVDRPTVRGRSRSRTPCHALRESLRAGEARDPGPVLRRALGGSSGCPLGPSIAVPPNKWARARDTRLPPQAGARTFLEEGLGVTRPRDQVGGGGGGSPSRPGTGVGAPHPPPLGPPAPSLAAPAPPGAAAGPESRVETASAAPRRAPRRAAWRPGRGAGSCRGRW